MLYLNMILIGRRHWAGGQRSNGLATHSPLISGRGAWVVALVGLRRPDRLQGRLAARQQRREALYAQRRIEGVDQADSGRSPGLHPGVLQPRRPSRIRGGQGQSHRPAPRIRRPRWRQDPAQPGRDRTLLGRGPGCSETVRDRAQAGGGQRGRAAVDHRDLPGRCLHLGPGRGRGAVLRPGPADRVRADPIDPGGLEVEPEEGRHPGDRRQDARRLRLPSDGTGDGVALRHRIEEAVRGQLGRARRPDPRRPRRAPGGPAVLDDPEADRRPDRLRPAGPPDPALPRPAADGQPFAGPRDPCKMPAGRLRSAAVRLPSPRGTCSRSV